MPYILGLTFCTYEFEKDTEQIKGYTISEIKNKINSLLYVEWGCQNPVCRQSQKHFHLYHTAKYHATVHAVLNYVEKITVVFLISIHTKVLTATAIVIKRILVNR